MQCKRLSNRIGLLIIGALFCLWVPLTHGEEFSAEFWLWYSTYSNEEGEVFDPLALFELSVFAQNAPKLGDTETKTATDATQSPKYTDNHNSSNDPNINGETLAQ